MTRSPEDATLIVGPSWIGDMVMAQSLLMALRRQADHASIDVLAPPALERLVGRMPEVRAFIPAAFGHGDFAPFRRFALGRSLRGRYTRAYVLPGSWKSALVPFAARIPRRTGYLREQRWGVLNDMPVLPSDLRRKTALLYQALADPAVLAAPDRLFSPQLRVDPTQQAALVAEHGLEGKAYAVLVPGAGFGSAKRWPLPHWGAVARELAAAGLTPVVVGAARDRGAAIEIATDCRDVVDLTGRTSLDGVIDLMSAAGLVVANDTGLLHVAAAVDVPVLGIYGSTSPSDTPPLSSRSETVSIGLPCSPCHARECPLGHHACMTDLLPAEVIRRARMLLES
jgi:heptosyltransferase-2